MTPLFWTGVVTMAAVPAVATALTAWNAARWLRPDPSNFSTSQRNPPRLGHVTLCIPARDEARTIAGTVEAALAAVAGTGARVLVCDDGSTDGTSEILAGLQALHPNLQVIQGAPLPEGWVGKVHACAQLADAAGEQDRNDGWLVYVDADVRVSPGLLAGLADVVARTSADVVSAVPRQETGSPFEDLVLPLLHLTYVSWLPLELVWRTQDPRFLAANGQILAIRRQALDDVGGFKAIRGDVVDDMALCRRMKVHGRRVAFVDGHHLGRCRMYRGAREVVDGFSKNLRRGLGSTVALLAVLGLYLHAFVAPWVVLAVGAAMLVGGVEVPAGVAPGLIGATVGAGVGVGLHLLQRLWLAARHQQPLWSALLAPVGVLGFVAIGLNAWRWHRQGAVRWKGRFYAEQNVEVIGFEHLGYAQAPAFSDDSDTGAPEFSDDSGAGAPELCLPDGSPPRWDAPAPPPGRGRQGGGFAHEH